MCEIFLFKIGDVEERFVGGISQLKGRLPKKSGLLPSPAVFFFGTLPPKCNVVKDMKRIRQETPKQTNHKDSFKIESLIGKQQRSYHGALPLTGFHHCVH